MITEEEKRRILAATAISASAAVFRRRRCPLIEHLRRGALTPPNFKEEVLDMAYDLHRINPGRLYVIYFAGDGGLVVEADKKAWGCSLKYLPEDVIIGCPAMSNFWEVRGFCSCLILRVVVGLPRGFVFAFGAEGPLSAHLSSLPTFLSLVLDFLTNKAFFLYNTLGFPINLTELMAQEAGTTVDMEGFCGQDGGSKEAVTRGKIGCQGAVAVARARAVVVVAALERAVARVVARLVARAVERVVLWTVAVGSMMAAVETAAVVGSGGSGGGGGGGGHGGWG
jgi:hypothetical protein